MDDVATRVRNPSFGSNARRQVRGEGDRREWACSDVLQQHIDTVLHLRDLFEKAGRAYRDADARAAEMLVNRTDGP